MGEKPHNYRTEDLSQAKEQTPKKLALPGEAVTVQAGAKQKEEWHSLMSAEVYTKPYLERVSKEPVRPSPLLKAFGDLFIANALLLVENEKLAKQVEQNNERNRKSSIQWQQDHRKEYNDYKREYMREYRAKKKQQQADSSSE